MKAGFLAGRSSKKIGVFEDVLPSGAQFRLPEKPTSSLLASLVPEKHKFITPELRKRLDPVPVFTIAIGDEPLLVSYRSPKAPTSQPQATFAFLYILPKDVEEVFKRLKARAPELVSHAQVVVMHLDEALEIESWSREHAAEWGFAYRFFANPQNNEDAAVLLATREIREDAAAFRRAVGEGNFATEGVTGLVPMFVSQLIRMAAAEGSAEQQTPLFFTLADVDFAVAQLKAAGGPADFADQERSKWVDPGSLQRVVASMMEAGPLLDIDEEWSQVCFFPNTEATETVQRMDQEVNEAPPDAMFSRRGSVAYDDATVNACRKIDDLRDKIARMGELGEYASPGDLHRMLLSEEAKLQGELARHARELGRLTREAEARAAHALRALAAGQTGPDLPAHREADLRLGSARRELDGTRLALVRRLAKFAEGGSIAVGPAHVAAPAREGEAPVEGEEPTEPIGRGDQLSALRAIADLASRRRALLEMHLEGCIPLLLTLMENADTEPAARRAAAAAVLRFIEADQSAKRRVLEENGVGPLLAAARDAVLAGRDGQLDAARALFQVACASPEAMQRVGDSAGFFNMAMDLVRAGPPPALERDLVRCLAAFALSDRYLALLDRAAAGEVVEPPPPPPPAEPAEEGAATPAEPPPPPPSGAILARVVAPFLRALRDRETVTHAALVLRLASAQQGQAALFDRGSVSALAAALGWSGAHPAARETVAQCVAAILDANPAAADWFAEANGAPALVGFLRAAAAGTLARGSGLPEEDQARLCEAAARSSSLLLARLAAHSPAAFARCLAAGALPAAVECARAFGPRGNPPAARGALRLLLLVAAQHEGERTRLLKAGAFEAALALLAGPSRAEDAPLRLAAALLVSLLSLRDRLRLDAAAADAVGRVADSMDLGAGRDLPWPSLGPLGDLLKTGVPSVQLLAAGYLADLSCAPEAHRRIASSEGAFGPLYAWASGGPPPRLPPGAGEEPLETDMFLLPHEPIEVARDRQRTWERRQRAPEPLIPADPRAGWIRVYARSTVARLCGSAAGIPEAEEEVQAKCADAHERRTGERAALEARAAALEREVAGLRQQVAALERAAVDRSSEATRARAAAAESQAALGRAEAEAAALRARLQANGPAANGGPKAEASPAAPKAAARRGDVRAEDGDDLDGLD